METLMIHSRLACFRMVERLHDIGAEAVCGAARFSLAPAYAGLEAMAQLAALHARHRIGLARHAFLLKIARCSLQCPPLLDGRFRLQAELRARAGYAFDYRARAEGPAAQILTADLLIGTQPYDERFRESTLRSHYQKVLACLRSDTD